MASKHSNPAAAAADTEPGTPSAAQVPLHLEVTQGRTRFRERPVPGPRFLIGADDRCDLRLGGDDIPALHSIITINGQEICLEALAETPELFVNGRHVSSAVLWDGDLIRIGAVELRARVAELPATPSAATAAPSADLEDAEVELAQLSAAELIELIEQEEAEVEQFTRRQQLGASALLQAVSDRGARQAPLRHRRHSAEERAPGSHFPNTTISIPGPRGDFQRTPETVGHQTVANQTHAELLQSIEELGQALHGMSLELQRRAERATEREAGYVAATSSLIEAQQQLVSQMELLTAQVQSLQSAPAERLKRAIA